jgi:uroporphyrinogen decarboxylase
MTGKQRVVAAFKGELADTIPAYPMTGQALGNELKFPDKGMCISKTLALVEQRSLAKLSVPDPYKDARMPHYLEACREAKQQLPDCPVSGVIAGPWTIAIGIRGATALLKDSMKDKGFVFELMEFTTAVAIIFGEAVRAQGVGLSYSEAPASCSLISPKIYRELIFPYHKRMVDHFRENRVRIGLHICGYADPILEDIVATGTSNLSIDAPSDLDTAMAASRDRAVVIGNVDTNLFIYGKREAMEEATKGCLETVGKRSGYILSTGCEVPGVASPESVEWFMEAARRLGRN